MIDETPVPVKTTVHVMRHGEVHNPDRILYGRLPDFHLSELGQEMARRMAEYLKDFDLVHLRCSPMERAQETIAPVADAHGLQSVSLDDVLSLARELYAPERLSVVGIGSDQAVFDNALAAA